MKIFLALTLGIFSHLTAQTPTPLEQSQYKTLTSNADLVSYIRLLDSSSAIISMDTVALSAGGKLVPVAHVSSDAKKTGKKSKLNVMIFAQQHGNEPSGKEGALLLLKGFAAGSLNALLENVNLILVPQMNPDGNDKDVRRNGNGADLNRNHLLLTEPEVIGLHELYRTYDPEVTLDVHEYGPYSREWKEYGYRKDFDETFGTLTNINTSTALREFQSKKFLPYIDSFLHERGFSFAEYAVGGPPNKDRLRHSTVDINDGRQSFGILGSLSFILEGKNGKDSIDNIQRRAEGQMTAMIGFLTFMNIHAEEIRAMVMKAKQELLKRTETAIQMEHVREGDQTLKLFSYATERETLITVANYHTGVESKLKVKQPKGYLVPKNDSLLVGFLKSHHVKHGNYTSSQKDNVIRYNVEYGKQQTFEEFKLPVTAAAREEMKNISITDYFFVPIEQRQSHMITLAFEPQSMINLLQYERFAYLMKEKRYPILRVE